MCCRIHGAAGDENGAGGVRGELDGDGADQQAGEPAEAAVADNDQLGGMGGVEQDRCRFTGDEFAVDVEVWAGGVGVRGCVGEDAFGLVAVRPRVARTARGPVGRAGTAR